MLTVFESAPLYGLIEALAGWRNWQTQGSQKPPRAISYRFDSDTRHHKIPLKSLQRSARRDLSGSGMGEGFPASLRFR